MQKVRRESRWQWQLRERNSDDAGLADKDTDVVEAGSIPGEPARL